MVTAFTTRPELRGTFGMVASTHWLASAAGMAVLERGGNAFDAAVAAGFTLQVVEPHLNGPGGDLPAVFWSAERGQPLVLCAQGISPAAATIERFRTARPRARPGHGRSRRVRPRGVRRLAAAPARFRHVAARGRARVRGRLRGARVSRRPGHHRDDRSGRAAPARVARFRRAVPSGAGARNALPQPRSSPRRTGGFATRRAAARGRTRSSARASSSTPASSRTRSTASAPPTAAC